MGFEGLGVLMRPRRLAGWTDDDVIVLSFQLVIPGDRAEMTEFQEKAANNTRMLLDLTLPNVNVVLHNKNFFEILYNRYGHLSFKRVFPCVLMVRSY